MIHDDEFPAILGIDPGLDGVVAWIFPDRAEARVTPILPAGRTGKRRFDVAAMVELLKAHPVDLAILEADSAAPVVGRVQGTTSMFGFGRGLGLWEGILAALAIPHQAVPPQTWKKVVLAGTARDKPVAIAF
jgi:crossover junction endodeoxyribonuclease RuvC